GNFEIEIVAVDIQEDLRPLAETIIGERIQMAFVRAPPDGTRAVLFGATDNLLPQTGSQSRWDAFAFEGERWVDYPCPFTTDRLSLASGDSRFGAVILSLRFVDEDPLDGFDLRAPKVEMEGEWWLGYDRRDFSNGTALAPLSLRGRVRLDEGPPRLNFPIRSRGPLGTEPFVLPFEFLTVASDEFRTPSVESGLGLTIRDAEGTVKARSFSGRPGSPTMFGCARLLGEDRVLDASGIVALDEGTLVAPRWLEGPMVTVETTEITRDLFGQPAEAIRSEYAILALPDPVAEVDFRAGNGVRFFGTLVSPAAPCDGRPCVGLQIVEGRWVGFVAGLEPDAPVEFDGVSALIRIDAEDCVENSVVDVLAIGSPDSQQPEAALISLNSIGLRRSGDGCTSGFRNLGPGAPRGSDETFRTLTVSYEFQGRNLAGPTTITLLSLTPTE
ncbi:MAG: hypothetical protein AAGJ19_22480, partial [Myxococcota bacterium]